MVRVNKNKNILVLGGSGQIGTPLCARLQSLGYKVKNFDIANSLKEDLRIYTKEFGNLVKKSDFIFFLAFDVGGSKYLEEEQGKYYFIENNMKIMNNVFSILERTKKPFLFTSTCMASMSWSPYGSLKLIGEHYSRSLNGIIVRLWNIYGQEPVGSKSHVITDFIQQSKEKNNINMLTAGLEKRQFMHVDDCVNVLYKLMINFNLSSKEKKIDISTGKWTSIKEVAEIISDHYSVEVHQSSKIDVVQMDKSLDPDLKFISKILDINSFLNLKNGIDNIIAQKYKIS